MRTRSKSKRKESEAEEARHTPEALKKKVSSWKSGKRKGKGSVEEPKANPVEEVCEDVGDEKNGSGEAGSSMKGDIGSTFHIDHSEMDWEDGNMHVTELKEHHYDSLRNGVTIEFSDLPSPSPRKLPRRASAKEKEIAELVHTVHLLCLLARGRLVDNACNDPLIQASLLSLLPSYLHKVSEFPMLTAYRLGSIVNWFSSNFCVGNKDHDRGSFKSNLAFALESREGTAEEVAALAVALFRALNLTTRFVSVLDVASLKPDADQTEDVKQRTPRLNTRISSSSKAAMSPVPGRISEQISSSLKRKDTSAGNGHTSPKSSKSNRREDSPSLVKRLFKTSNSNRQSGDCSAEASPSKASQDEESSTVNQVEKSKRKGDLEFELQLEMALSATSVAVPDGCLDLKEDENGASHSVCSPLRRLRNADADEDQVTHHHSGSGDSGAVWSRRSGPPLYWAEVYCDGEEPTGRWVHVDAANRILDGEAKVEAAVTAARKQLRYVVAFGGGGAKDVTRRYCMQWYKITPQRISSDWWSSVMAPLRMLESGATSTTVYVGTYVENPMPNTGENVERSQINELDCKGLDTISTAQKNSDSLNSRGVASRSSLEDMDLETRALTEPLPTNQQAYRNHHLYAIEKWLTKHQILYPKGPILGFCSGYPVYPRTCVQNLQTKHRWLREGLQVKANEAPAKIIERSKSSSSKIQISKPSATEEDDIEENVELYGKWQLEPLRLPHAVNGIVPKNERGQVDAWSEKCLPPGTVHMRLPRLVPIVKRLEIDYAPAMVGFEFRNGRAAPVFEGLVVCTEFKDAILEAYAEEEERRQAEERKRNEAQALSRWYQLLSSIVTRQRLQNSYMNTSSSYHESSTKTTSRDQLSSGNNNFDNGLSLKEPVEEKGQDRKSDYEGANIHEHFYPLENQSFDEETSVRVKRCPCGFSVQVEEL